MLIALLLLGGLLLLDVAVLLGWTPDTRDGQDWVRHDRDRASLPDTAGRLDATVRRHRPRAA